MANDREHLPKGEVPGGPDFTRKDFDRLHPKLIAVLRKLEVPSEDARDLAQKALLEAHKGFHNFKGRSEFDTWVVSIAKNLLLQYRRDQGRQKRRGEEVPLDDKLPAEDFEEQVIARDLLRKALAAIRTLPEERQQPLLLLAQGFKYREIAQILGVSENRVSSLIHEARKKLRRELGDRSTDSGS